MQAKNYDGSYSPIEEFSAAAMSKLLSDPNVEHVEVFEATEENIEYRKKLLGVKKRYQKASKTNPKGISLPKNLIKLDRLEQRHKPNK